MNNFDLQLVSVAEVINGYPKAAAGYLLNGRALRVAVVHWGEPLGVFTAFTGIRLAA